MTRSAWPAVAAALFVTSSVQAQPSAPAHTFLTVQAPAGAGPLSGRLLVFAEPLERARADAKGGAVEAVDADFMHADAVTVAGREVESVAPGGTVEIDLDAEAFPTGFSRLKPGRYVVQAVLDPDHSYTYSGRGAGDVVSKVVEVDLPAAHAPALALDHAVPPRDPWAPRPGSPPERARGLAAARAASQPIDFISPSLSAFWGRPIHMRGWVLLPPGYAAGGQRYPTLYYTHGFGGGRDSLVGPLASAHQLMAAGEAPPMIWVFLDESSPTGTHEFADSVNNGPWGQALTTELIPALEARYRMEGKPSGRLLNGHSSGGWATLWLQTRYPKVFGGTWSTSPDPSDFHDYTGVDLYAPNANVYRRPDGSPYPLVRDKGQVRATYQQFAQLEAALGPYGGQMSSFEWVFSPRGQDGRPMKLFDRSSGAVDPAVVSYWRDHYDIAERIKRDWPALKPDLDGKIHVVVGTADTFYLDGAAHRLQAVLDGLGARSSFRYLPGKTHFDLYRSGDDPAALTKEIVREMYAVARPNAAWRPLAMPGPQPR